VIHAIVRSNYHYNWGKNYYENLEYSEIIIYPTEITEAYPNEAVYVENDFYQGYVIIKLTTHKWGGLKKTQFSYETSNYWQSTLYQDCDELYFYELCPAEYDYVLFEYTQEYGFLEYFDSGFEWGGHKEIVGVIDNGDTLGIIYPTEMFVGQDEINKQSNFLVYPSPAKEKLHIKTNQTGQSHWSIFDISGRRILTGKKEKSVDDMIIQVENLPRGVYVLKLDINQHILRKKFLKY
jgi:hypothetical protein